MERHLIVMTVFFLIRTKHNQKGKIHNKKKENRLYWRFHFDYEPNGIPFDQ